MGFEQLLKGCVTLAQQIITVFSGVWEYMTQPISVTLAEAFGNTGNVLFDTLVGNLIELGIVAFFDTVFPDVSLLSIMLGVGLTAYIIWQLVSWVIDIFP